MISYFFTGRAVFTDRLELFAVQLCSPQAVRSLSGFALPAP
jgi:hypothetical protein